MECGLHGPSQSLTKDYFPWFLLPRELQVKILRNLSRRDVDSCRLLNRDMLELIRCNERWMKRRFIDQLRIRTMYDSTIQLDVCCHEEGIKKTLLIGQALNLGPLREHLIMSGQCRPSHLASSMKFEHCLLRIFKNADVRDLWFSEEYLTDSILRTVSAYLQHAGSKISSLWITEIPRHHVTSAALLQLLRVADPMELFLDGFLPRDDSCADLLQFVVKRPYVSLRSSYGSLIPIDDDILAGLTANSFYIGAPNLITVEDLMNFVKNLASRKQKVDHGMIFSNYCFFRNPFPVAANAHFKVVTGICGVEIIGRKKRTKKMKKRKMKRNMNELERLDKSPL